MIKRVVKFSKLFIPCIIFSAVLMVFSIVGLFVKGVNFGLDFQAGFIERVRIVPTAFTLSYEGPKTVMFSLSSLGIDITSTAVDGDSEARSFLFSKYNTIGQFMDDLKDFEGLKISLMEGVTRDTPFASFIVDSQVLPRLSPTPYKVHYMPKDEKVVTSDDIRHALNDAGLPSDAVQQLGKASDGIFQIRLPDDGSSENVEHPNSEIAKAEESSRADVASSSSSDISVEEGSEEMGSEQFSSSDVVNDLALASESSKEATIEDARSEVGDEARNGANVRLHTLITNALNKAFGEDNIVVIGTDFVGSRFSTSLAKQAVQLVLGALLLIFLYAMFRFRWDFALGGILALLHDTLAIFAFIVWTQMEFNSISIAAVLTIIGYSINDTVVIFDRIRENISLNPKETCTDILDISLSEVLGRTIITTVTTMLAAFSLYIFTSGSMKDFAMCLIIGMLSGTYSSIYIASACINFFCRKKKGEEMFVSKTNPAGVSV